MSKKSYYYIYYKVEKWNWRPKDMGGTSTGSHVMECQDIIDIHPIEFQLDCNKKYNKEYETTGGYTTREEYMVIHWIKLTKAEYDKYVGHVG